MKILLISIICLCAIAYLRADDSKYEKAMKKNIALIDSAMVTGTMLEVANNFERIALTEKDKWLPYYYASFLYVITSFSDTTNENKDNYLDKADQFINIADSLQPDESEIYTLKGMIDQARMQVDPMNRWMKYGAAANNNFNTAMNLDSLNPRPEYLMGIGLYYTPEQFGGGPKTAKPVLEKSLDKYNRFVPDNDVMPVWGRKMVEQLLQKINESLKDTTNVN